ncbi:hypothetical protein LF1_50530 [Rubripirellula obstinata]|uniref:Uncharacterized protein n=1 Tax=Rubripirellula obstinata TaxID=406547 RepID=A0A5B1CN89_9BACT|nr:hypothetical protein [Rubripirellula obstinata]KAA1262488.1 hypothetical protein LF1_50530 [Rubripirellula obstinata]
MKLNAAPRLLLSDPIFVLIAGAVLFFAGCGGSSSVPAEPDQANPAEANPAEATVGGESDSLDEPSPPGGMELPSDLDANAMDAVKRDANDNSPANSDEGTSFELPE